MMISRRQLYNLFTNNEFETERRYCVPKFWMRCDDAVVVTVVLLNLVVLQLETLSAFEFNLWLRVAERGCLLFFILELALRFYAYTGLPDYRFRLSRPKTCLRSLHRFLNFDHLLDVTIVITGILSEIHWLIDLKILSVFQLFRLLRLLKLTRYLASSRRLGKSFRRILPDLMVSLGVCLFVMLISSYIFFQVEHAAQPDVVDSAPAAMWWAIITLTTVGYGDLYPVTVAGKILTALTAVSSIGILAIPAGLFAQALLGSEERDGANELDEMRSQIQQLESKLDLLIQLQQQSLNIAAFELSSERDKTSEGYSPEGQSAL